MNKINNKRIKLRMFKEIDNFFNGIFDIKFNKKPDLTKSSFCNKIITKQKKN
jgi:hypothetical protein